MAGSNQHSELVATIREALPFDLGMTYHADHSHVRAHAALDELVEQLQTAESERDEWEKRYEELLSAVGGVWPG